MKALLRALGSLVLLAGGALAQSTGGSGSGSNEGCGGDRDQGVNLSSTSAMTGAAANQIAAKLRAAADCCDWAPGAYVVGCLANQYTKIERSLPRTAAYAEGTGQNMVIMRRVFCLRRSAGHLELQPL